MLPRKGLSNRLSIPVKGAVQEGMGYGEGEMCYVTGRDGHDTVEGGDQEGEGDAEVEAEEGIVHCALRGMLGEMRGERRRRRGVAA